jgi:hypothetical protein
MMTRVSGNFAPNRHQRIQPVHLRHLQVHQSDVGPVRPELLDRFAAIGSFGHQGHVRLCRQQRRNPVPEQGVVIDR